MTIGLLLAASESRMIWSTTITSTEQEKATSTTATAIYGLLSSRISFADFWLLEMGSERIPTWQTERKQSQVFGVRLQNVIYASLRLVAGRAMVLVAPGPAKPSSLPPYDIGGTLPEPRAYPGAYV